MKRPLQDERLVMALRDHGDDWDNYQRATQQLGLPRTHDEVQELRKKVEESEARFLDLLEDFVARRSPQHTHPHDHEVLSVPEVQVDGEYNMSMSKPRTSREG